MHILKVAIILLLTVIALPLVVVRYSSAPTEFQIVLLKETFALVLIVTIYCFVVGEITRNNSQVDKLWSILPVIYTWFMTYRADFVPRMVLMSCLISIWGLRLTYNFARRGAYQRRFWAGEEDYRWPILRKTGLFQNKFVWCLFDLLFICFYQNALIFAFTIPVLSSLAIGAKKLGVADYLLAVLHVTIIITEYFADQQQFTFQQEKHKRINAKEKLEEYEAGFLQKGLWAVVRHPNYACEQASWVVIYLFSISATSKIFNWTIVGMILLLILFKSSADFSEDITKQKYPKYAEYCNTVPRFIPNLISK